METPEAFTYRVSDPRDLPGVLELWGEASGWGEISLEVWKQYYVDRPLGPSLVAAALDSEERVAAFIVFNRTLLRIADREVNALHMAAPVVRADKRARSLNLSHPVVGLYISMVAEAAQQGYGILYATPNRPWVPFFRRAPERLGFPHVRFNTAEPGCWGIDPASIRGESAETLVASPADAAADEYDALWHAAVEAWRFPVVAVRDSRAALKSREVWETVDVRDSGDGALIAYCAVRERDWLIVDLLIRRPDDAAGVLTAVARTLDGRAEVLKAMDFAALTPAFEAAGFHAIDFRFGFVAMTLEESIPFEMLEYPGWWIGPLG